MHIEAFKEELAWAIDKQFWSVNKVTFLIILWQ